MAEVNLERLVLPALLALLVLGAFIILATNGGGDEQAGSAAPTSKSAPAPKAKASSVATPKIRFVKVQNGDTPTSIADKAHISVDRLRELNPSLDPSSLHPGQTLKLAP